MRRTILREKDDRFCEAEIWLEDGRLSVTGTEGRIVSREEAEVEALDYWTSFFEDSPAEIGGMVQRFTRRVFDEAEDSDSDERALAKYVVKHDGPLHGLDVHSQDGDRVYVTESCGCLHDTLKEWFPELAPLIPWHLNDLAVKGHPNGRKLPKKIIELAETACKEG